MSFLRTMRLTPSQAREIASLGFVVTLVKMFCGETDEYNVYVKERNI